MCGVLGIYSYNARDVSDSSFDNMVDSLAHRGPDGRGTYRDPEENLRLGHRRLSILDTSESGSQPMSDPSGRYWITFNGEIYNFLEIKEELEKKGYVFRTESDTEVALYSFIEWKEDCQLKFNGMWGLAIWDQKEKRCFFSRDRFGVKPLYIFDDGKRWAFASELKAFLNVEELDTYLDESKIAEDLSNPNDLLKHERTILKNAYQVLAGHCGWFDKEKKTQIFLWWKTYDHIPEVPSSKKDRIEVFRELVIDAVRVRMRSDVPIGCALSGGLDSSSVLCCMNHISKTCSEQNKRESRNWKNIFSVSSPGTVQDEGKYVDFLSSHLQIETNYCIEDPSLLAATLKKWLYHSEAAVGPIAGGWLLYKEFRKKNISISLEGHGVDELLGGYHHFIRDSMHEAVFSSFNMFRFLQLSRMLKTMYEPDFPGVSGQTAVILEFIKSSGVKLLKKQPRLYQVFCSLLKQSCSSPNFLRPLTDKTRPSSYLKEMAENSLKNLDRRLYNSFHFDNLPKILQEFDRASMAHGVEIRSPFMDWRVVTYCFALKASEKIQGGYTKKILRDAMKGILPDLIRLRKSKLGFQSPLKEWLKTDLKTFVLDSVHDESFLNSSIWNGPLIRDFIQSAYKENDIEKVMLGWKYIQANCFISTMKEKKLSMIS